MKHLSSKHWLFSTMLLTATMGLTACSSDSDIKEPETPVTPVTPETPSTVDNKKWDLDQYMDTINATPGSDFAMYCWGKWYDAAAYGDGISKEVNDATTQRYNAMDRTYRSQLTKDLKQLTAIDEDGLKALRAEIDQLEAYAKENTSEAAWKAIAQYLASGRNELYSLSIASSAADIRKPVLCLDAQKLLCELGNDPYIIKASFEALGLSSAEAEERLKDAANVVEMEQNEQQEETGNDGNTKRRSDVLPHLRVHPMNTGTRSAATATAVLAEKLNVPADLLSLPEDTTIDMLALEKQPAAVCRALECAVAQDAFLVDPSMTTVFKDGASNALNGMAAALYCYSESKEFCDKYITADVKTKIQELAEEIRSAALTRIDSISWLTNKEGVKKKVKSIQFNVSSPDQWYTEALPTLEGKSLLGDMRALRQARLALARKLLTVSNLAKDNLSASYGQIKYNAKDGTTAFDDNAFYDPTTISVNLPAANFLSPYYREEISDAYLYAHLASLVGHEMGHSLDVKNVFLDADGNPNEAMLGADSTYYDEQAQRLADCYDKLPYGPDSKSYNKGIQTLGENMSDLTGVEAGLQAYTSKLVKEGYKGDELVKQQKRFFQAWSWLWHDKKTEEKLVETYDEDVHASFYSRSFGPMMNVDKWYEVFGVKQGDNLYLRPAERTHIW
jgi:putative endopeptidase